MGVSDFGRRDFLKTSAAALSTASVVGMMGADSYAAPVEAKAKSVIQIWLWGGPTHTDMFDPKPKSGYDYCGELSNPIETNVPGIMIGELLPNLANHADKYSLIRSMTHGNNGHETASYLIQTGRKAGGRLSFPGCGAVVTYLKGTEENGYKSLLPPYVVLTQYQGRFAEEGFLSWKYKPFATGGDPAKDPFRVQGIVSDGVSQERQFARRNLLEKLDTVGFGLDYDDSIMKMKKSRDAAYAMILGKSKEVFNLSSEPTVLRDQYGMTTFGQSCLAASRLVQAGVPYVTINSPGWDTHSNHFPAMKRKLPELDQGVATLLEDLDNKGILDSTIVLCGGEFGRTPRVAWEPPWNGGRHHFGKVFSYLVAGGGFKGGHVVGSSDDTGENVKERPVYPVDLLGSIYGLMGIDVNTPLPNPFGEEVFVLPSPEEDPNRGGLLTEIM